MTVNTTDITSGPYSGNDVTTEFAYDFRVDDKTQLIVYETDDAGVETVLTVDTDYTVAGIGDDGGGTITRVAGALPTGYTWYIRSNYQATQLTAFASQGAFFPRVHESAFDKLTFLLQQVTDRVGRSLRFRDSYSGGASAVMPDPEALKFLRWNSAANALENTSGTTSAVASDVASTAGDVQTDINRRVVTFDSVAAMDAAAFLQTGQKVRTLGYYAPGDGGGNDYKIVAAGTGTADGGSYIDLTGSGLQAKGLFVDGSVNVKQFGAVGDDSTDDRAALINTHAYSDEVIYPSGIYRIASDLKDLFNAQSHLVFRDGAMLSAATGVTVFGNSAAVSGNLTQHFKHPDYSATQWATATAYSVGDIVQFEYGRYYKCASSHTSGTFTTDKAAGKFVAFAPFSFFQRVEADNFVYPEWFGAIADSTTLSSTPIANALSCNSVTLSLTLNESGGSQVNGYYRLTKPLVVLNGRTLCGGDNLRAAGLLRIDGAAWVGGNLGISSEEVSGAPANVLGYTSYKNCRFQIEGMVNTDFVWFRTYMLETSNAEQITWEFIGSNTIKQEAEFFGGPAKISDLNIVYGDTGTVEDHPLYFNMFNGCVVRNINYKNQLGKRGLKIRPGRFTDISGIFIENGPTVVSEPYLLIEESGESNGRIGEVYITNNKASDSTGLALEVNSNLGLSSFLSNVNLENIYILPHDGVGSALDETIKINGVTWTKAQLQDATGNNRISINKISQNEFQLAGTRNQHSDGPVRSSWHYTSIANSAVQSIHFAPILRQGGAADTFQAWCGLIMISARGVTDLSYCAFVGLQQGTAGVYSSTVTELAGAANFSVAWNNSTFKWDITNTSGTTANQVIISFVNQGPNIFTK